MCVQNSISLSAAVHELSCPQTFLPYLAMVNNPQKIQSHDLDLEVLWVSCGCQDTQSRKISWSKVQRFMSYRENREKTHLKTTVHRYHTVMIILLVIN